LRLAETEKYAHVTFFFNGGREQPFEGEDRILIPSPKVATYDQKPEMSASEVTDHLVGAIESGAYDAHRLQLRQRRHGGPHRRFPGRGTGHRGGGSGPRAGAQGVAAGAGEMIVTADHGNAEQMLDRENDQPHTAHTSNLVPLIYVGRSATLKEDGALCDVAPSLLALMGLEQPMEMLGHSLVEFLPGQGR
jgi:2,3-bisphosphoglycerate-independent phosphoglycerate mutase